MTFRQFQLSTNLGSFGGVEMKDNVRDNWQAETSRQTMWTISVETVLTSCEMLKNFCKLWDLKLRRNYHQRFFLWTFGNWMKWMESSECFRDGSNAKTESTMRAKNAQMAKMKWMLWSEWCRSECCWSEWSQVNAVELKAREEKMGDRAMETAEEGELD